MQTRLSIGVDLAQARDRTALAAVASYRATASDDSPRRKLHHDLVALDRLRPGISYTAQVEIINAFADKAAADGARPVLYVDQTGVGRPVLDLLRQGCPYVAYGVTITPGASITRTGQDWTVPKADLIGSLEVALSTRRIHASADLPFAGDLDKELHAFGYDLTNTGRPKFEARAGHDDLVLALSLAVWGAENGGGSGAAFLDMMRDDLARRNERGQRA